MAAAGTLQTLLTLKNRCFNLTGASSVQCVDKSVYEIEGCSVVKHNFIIHIQGSSLTTLGVALRTGM